MSKKKTPWFPASMKPVRDGVYEVHRNGVSKGYPARTRLLWEDGEWLHTNHSCPSGAGFYANMDDNTGDKWRGLAQKPEGT